MTATPPTHDRFELRLFFKTSPLATWDSARPFLEALLHAAPPLAPTIFFPKHDQREPLSLDAIAKHFGHKQPPDALFLGNDQEVAVELSGFPPSRNPAGKMIVRCPFKVVEGASGSERVMQLVTELGRLCPLVYGWGHSEEDVRLAKDPHVTNTWAPKEIYQAYGLTILGAAIVKKLTPAKVAATPAHRVELLDDGSALIETFPDFASLLSPEARRAQAAALAHLRPGRTMDEILHELQERSAKLEPVERKWNPEMADVLRIIVDTAPLAQRAALETQFNSFHPPAIPTWQPVAEALPANVDDQSAAIDSYHRQGQTFVAGFHDQITDLMNADPESLPFIDAHFYLRDYPAKHDRTILEQKFVPTLGAHLGTILERYLEGTWVPRKKIEETQVVVGDRAWLPFLHVKHFLASRQAALEFSLTRLFREAEQHAPNQRE